MKLEHYYVNVVDLPEVLPFTVGKDNNEAVEDEVEAQAESGEALFKFVEALEDFDNVHYIGQDNVEGKFYQRFLFEGGGFMEVMQQAPCAVIAHFSNADRADAFVEALKTVIREHATDSKAADMLAGDITVSEEEEGSLSYERWSKLRNVRESIR